MLLEEFKSRPQPEHGDWAILIKFSLEDGGSRILVGGLLSRDDEGFL